jgi:hypothetical protein
MVKNIPSSDLSMNTWGHSPEAVKRVQDTPPAPRAEVVTERTATRSKLLREEVRATALRKNIQYGALGFFRKPGNANKKAILAQKLGIDLEKNPVNSDTFLAALADFQAKHRDEIGYDPDGWFGILPNGTPTPTWRVMFPSEAASSSPPTSVVVVASSSDSSSSSS